MQQKANSIGDCLKYFGVGFAAGAAGGYAGYAAGGIVGTMGGFGSGAFIGAAGGFAGGFVNGAGNAWASNSSFADGIYAGFVSGGIGAVTYGVICGVSYGIAACCHGRNFWTGYGVIHESLASPDLSPNDVRVGAGLEYTNEFANDVAYYSYGNVEYVASLQVNDVPHGYSLENGCIINSEGRIANGVTIYVGKGKSAVYLGKSAFTSLRQLQLTIGHEYIHATQNYMLVNGILHKGEEDIMAEVAAYNWESSMGVKNGYEIWTQYDLGAWSWRRRPYYNWLSNAKF